MRIARALFVCLCTRPATAAAVLLLALTDVSAQASRGIYPRDSYKIPFVRLTLTDRNDNGDAAAVRISVEGSIDYVNITATNDEHVRRTRKGVETTVYREAFERAAYVSDFEASQLRTVTYSLISVLEGLEDDIRGNKWGRIHYLDGFLLKFLRAYYYLCDAVVAGKGGLPRSSQVPDTAFDVSTASQKTDDRIRQWRLSSDHVVKLRIATRTLIDRLRFWANASSSGKADFFDDETKKAFDVFVRAYLMKKDAPIKGRPTGAR